MTNLKIVSTTALFLACLAVGAPKAMAATPEACRGGDDRVGIGNAPLSVSTVHVLKTKRQVGKHSFDVKAGVSLVIPAELGVSKAYVERAVACELARGSGARGVFAVAGVTAKVFPIVGGYVVDVHAPTGKVDEVIQVAMDHHSQQRAVAKNDSSVR